MFLFGQVFQNNSVKSAIGHLFWNIELKFGCKYANLLNVVEEIIAVASVMSISNQCALLLSKLSHIETCSPYKFK